MIHPKLGTCKIAFHHDGKMQLGSGDSIPANAELVEKEKGT